jgi:DNA invertase Pin-like site-specific DNA recombinase
MVRSSAGWRSPVRAGLVDTVVVYKVDRLTRSLTDSAKMVELFDARGVSFVAVTQQFKTCGLSKPSPRRCKRQIQT